MNKISFWLTKRYLRSIKCSFIRTQTVCPPGEKEQEVIVVSTDKWPLLGQRTLFGTTIISQTAFRSQRLLNYVIIHEIGHGRQWWGYPIYLLVIVCAIVFTMSFFLLLWSLSASIISSNTSYLLTGIFSIVVGGFALLLLGVYSWALELNAEFYAIRKLGLQYVKDVRTEIPKRQDISWYYKAVGLLTHPPRRITYSLYSWTHRKANEAVVVR